MSGYACDVTITANNGIIRKISMNSEDELLDHELLDVLNTDDDSASMSASSATSTAEAAEITTENS